MNTIYLTGATGFIGRHLTYHLIKRDLNPIAVPSRMNDFEGIRRALLQLNDGDTIVHLAAVSDVTTSERDPSAAYMVNVGGTALLLEVLANTKKQIQFIFASTAQVYEPPTKSPSVIDELWTIAPPTIHGRTKYMAELLIENHQRQNSLFKATILRIFNHTHKDQSDRFLLGSVYKQLVNAESSKECGVSVGNIDLWRDIGSITDLSKAFYQVIIQPSALSTPRVFNVCSGREKNLRKIIELLALQLGKKIKIYQDAAKFRANEPTSVVGSFQKIKLELGWTPDCQTEHDLIDAFLKDESS